jgi:hypothetical protein
MMYVGQSFVSDEKRIIIQEIDMHYVTYTTSQINGANIEFSKAVYGGMEEWVREVIKGRNSLFRLEKENKPIEWE